MKIQISPNWWSCFATSFAIVLKMPVRNLFLEVGHDGSEIIFPDLPEPFGRRTIHPQELIDVCLGRGFALMMVEAIPSMSGNYEIQFKEGNISRLTRYMSMYTGVVCGVNQDLKPHAIAWDRKSFYDPIGKVTEKTEMAIDCFLALVPIRKEDGSIS